MQCLSEGWSSQITHLHLSNIHPLAHILGTWVFSLPQRHRAMASHPSPCEKWREGDPKEERNQAKMAAWNSFINVCTRALHTLVFFEDCHADSTVIPLLSKATFTPSIQPPNLSLLCTRTPLTYTSNTVINIHPLAHILDTWALIFSSCALFTVYPNSIPPISMW